MPELYAAAVDGSSKWKWLFNIYYEQILLSSTYAEASRSHILQDSCHLISIKKTIALTHSKV
ncbi:hypothetical protein T4D_13533 [Trichinella pseudospiralis]|uniref:Uncharacterized protein n=1 Tax=Trichinella pseudospiralis TaxID=6337 RepID=A0A0V1FPA5_TRIPS|nr:hypothetical protein T4D_13533 [Trichinella pseudospiralis]